MVAGPSLTYEQPLIEVQRRSVENPESELARLERALSVAAHQLEKVQQKAGVEAGSEEAAIFEAHSLFLSDPSLLGLARSLIEDQRINAEAGWHEAIGTFARKMDELEDEYLRARAADVRDVGQRVLRILVGVEETAGEALSQPSIVVARDLSPSDTMRLDKKLVLAFCTAEGGPTSHTAILARSLGIPAVVGLGPDVLAVPDNANLAVDGGRGLVIVNPSPETLHEFEVRRLQAKSRSEADLKRAHEPAVTRDGHRVEVVANVGWIEGASESLEYGAEGIGLLRTEFLYLDRRSAPTEEEQFAAFRRILESMETRPVVVRTLDVGGDKELPYIDLGSERNPFLGWRAIRMCLDQPEFFKVQLRALLRASPGHDLRIMFPMVSTLDEVRQAKDLLGQARKEVEDAGLEIAPGIQVGIMVEVPAVAVMARHFASEVDFFSIGTNDLAQYTLAAERTNQRVAHLSDGLHPAVLRLVKEVVMAADEAGIWVGLCGELAGEAEAIPILLGLGIDELSMAPASIPGAKAILRAWTLRHAQAVAAEALTLDSAAAVRELVRDQAASAKEIGR